MRKGLVCHPKCWDCIKETSDGAKVACRAGRSIPERLELIKLYAIRASVGLDTERRLP